MPNQQLVQYLQQQKQAGYDLFTLRNHLISSGYSEQDVDQAIDAAESSQATQADQGIVNYIAQLKNTGYTREQSRQYMMQYGYSAQQIDPALNQVFGPVTVEHVHKLHISTIAVIGVVVAAILLSSYLMFSGGKVGELLDVTDVSVAKATMEPGETLMFTYELSNEGSSTRYDVVVRYEIYDSKNNLIVNKEETVAMETKFSKKARIKLPDNLKPGDYIIRVTAVYDEQEATSTDNFMIPGEEKPIKEKPVKIHEDRDDDEEPIGTEDIKEDKEEIEEGEEREEQEQQISLEEPIEEEEEEELTQQEEARIGGLSPVQVFDEISQLKGRKITKAKRLCNALKDTFDKDRCLDTVARKTDVAVLCKDIIDSDKRDGCYMNFVLDGRFAVCDKISDEIMRESCEAYRGLNEIQMPVENVSEANASAQAAPLAILPTAPAETTPQTEPETQPVTEPTQQPAETIPETEPETQPVTEPTQQPAETDIASIVQLANTDPDEAKKQCDNLIEPEQKDLCFISIADEIESSLFCSYAQNESLMDDCYMNYAFSTTDYSICAFITDEFIKEECEALGSI